MSKAKKEFKRRISKVHKHLEALYKLAPEVVGEKSIAPLQDEVQEVQDRMNVMFSYLKLPDTKEERKAPHAIAN